MKNRELLLLRHGKSDWSGDTDDYHRPLKERGRKGARRIGAWLQRQRLLPDHIIASPATRALTTACITAKAMGISEKQVHQDQRIYEASLKDLLQVLGSCPDTAQRVLLVGHNPGLEELLTFLASDPVPVPTDGKLLPTATLARLAMPDHWQNLPAGCARLLTIQRARDLPENAAFSGS